MPSDIPIHDRDWNSIFERYRPRVIKIVQAIVRDEGYSEDVTQEVFVKTKNREDIFLLLHEFQRMKFLRKTAVNLALNHCRRQRQKVRDQRRDRTLDLEVQCVAAGPGLSTASDLLQKQIDVDAAIGRLPKKRHQLLIKLHYFEELSYVSMAEVLGESVYAIEKAVPRILAKLKKDPDLRKWIFEPSDFKKA